MYIWETIGEMKNVEKTISGDLAEYLRPRRNVVRRVQDAVSESSSHPPDVKNLEEHLRECARRALLTPSGDD